MSAGKLYMDLSEYVRRPDLEVPLEVSDKIVRHHLHYGNFVRKKLSEPLIVSQNSGYRHPDHEKEKGRKGSEHEFGKNSKGAVDYTVSGKNRSKKAILERLNKLCDLLFKYTPYTRITLYPTKLFIHADYRKTEDGKRHYYEAKEDKNGKVTWKFIKHIN